MDGLHGTIILIHLNVVRNIYKTNYIYNSVRIIQIRRFYHVMHKRNQIEIQFPVDFKRALFTPIQSNIKGFPNNHKHTPGHVDQIPILIYMGSLVYGTS